MQLISVLISGCVFFSHESMASQRNYNQDDGNLSKRMREYGIPQNLRTGTVQGEANGVLAPGIVLQDESIPEISAEEIRSLAQSKVNSATHVFETQYSEAVIKFVPHMFLSALPPKILNNIGFQLSDTLSTLAMRYENLAFRVRDNLSFAPQKDALMATAFLMAATKLSTVEKNINYLIMGASPQDRQEILSIKIDYKLSVAQLMDWARHHNKSLKLDSAIQMQYVAAMTLLPLAGTETQLTFEPLCHNWFDKLMAEQQEKFNVDLTKSLAYSMGQSFLLTSSPSA